MCINFPIDVLLFSPVISKEFGPDLILGKLAPEGDVQIPIHVFKKIGELNETVINKVEFYGIPLSFDLIKIEQRKCDQRDEKRRRKEP